MTVKSLESFRVWEMELARVAERLREARCPIEDASIGEEAVYYAALNAVATSIEEAIVAVPQEIEAEAKANPLPSLADAFLRACFQDEEKPAEATRQ